MSTDFVVLARSADVPFRSRRRFTGCATFGAGARVLVAPSVAKSLRDAARRAQPKETSGMVAGRVLRDQNGTYLLVTGAVEAPPSTGQVGHVHLGPDATSDLRAQLELSHPSADVVGWWHSHLAPSNFSSIDRTTQRLWANPHHVGLLVFAAGAPWARAYQGPDATMLEANESGAPVRSAPEGHGPVPASSPEAPSAPPAIQLPATSCSGPIRRFPLWQIIGSALIASGLAAGAVVLVQLSRAVESRLPASPVPAPITWSCTPATVSSIECTAAVSGSASIHWMLDGRVAGQGPSVVLDPRLAGLHSVALIIDADGKHLYAGEQAVPTLSPTRVPASNQQSRPVGPGLGHTSPVSASTASTGAWVRWNW